MLCESSMNRFQNAFGENVRMPPVFQRHVGSFFNRLEGGWVARNAGQCDRLTAIHADSQTDRPCSLSCCCRRRYGCGGRGRWLWLWFTSTAKKCESQKCPVSYTHLRAHETPEH